ncbi:MAG: SOS response-associated peptidase family protein [Oleiphilaceae bacterium]|nr:SOS response-associated peptidase family protein [Oleiphilaceae bacterium]
MCGRVNVNDDKFTQALMRSLGLDGRKPRISPDIAPGARLSIVRESEGERRLDEAVWWLLLDPKTLKPNYRYASFNCRSDKLNVPRSASFQPFRSQRCIIPVSGFVEGLGDRKHYYQLDGKEQALALGGVYRQWLDHDSGEWRLSTAIITLPGHPRMQTIHPKSQPLILPQSRPELITAWLDGSAKDVSEFMPLMQPCLPQNLVVTPIDRPGSRRPVAASFELSADAA